MTSLVQDARVTQHSVAATTRASTFARPRSIALTEKQLFEIWRGQRFPEGALVTRHGVPVRVIFPGRPGRGPGPDFRDAAIAGPSGVTLRGDIELHVRSSLFRAHGHAGDPAYASVILHVVFDDDLNVDTPLPGGKTAPVVALAPWVARRAEELQRWLERPLLWREPCHDTVMRLGADAAGQALDAEGDRRFNAKARGFEVMVSASGIEQALYEAFIESLGYGGNATSMRAVARLLPYAKLAALAGDGADRQARLDALLIGAAGLLPSQRGHRGTLESNIEEMERIFAGARIKTLPAGVWKLWGIRPSNHPVRRLAAAAALLSRLGRPTVLLGVADATNVGEAIAPLLATASGFWRNHFDVCGGTATLPPAFVGRSRALEILVNVVLPAAAASGDAELATKARRLYARLPRPAAYGVTKFIENALASEGIRVPINARRAQGLLGLNHDWCTQNGCGRCVLSSD